MRPVARAISAILVCALLLGGAMALAEEKQNPPAPNRGGAPGAGSKASAPASQKAQAKSSPRTIYVPPRGAPGTRTGGGTRGSADAPRIAVLAPDHIGLTTRAQPTLAWYLSAPTRAPVELTLIADDAAEPLAVKRLPSPSSPGIHVVDLAQQGVRLEEGVIYDWYIALVLDPNARDADVVAGGAIQRRAAEPALVAELRGSEPSYSVLARHGIWYDAIGDLSAAVATAPADTQAGQDLRAERAALLEQVGVGAVAVYDREGADGRDERK